MARAKKAAQKKASAAASPALSSVRYRPGDNNSVLLMVLFMSSLA